MLHVARHPIVNRVTFDRLLDRRTETGSPWPVFPVSTKAALAKAGTNSKAAIATDSQPRNLRMNGSQTRRLPPPGPEARGRRIACHSTRSGGRAGSASEPSEVSGAPRFLVITDLYILAPFGQPPAPV